jgi:mono/diheme cytochrome c family protein
MTALVEGLPSTGDHHTNGPVTGPDERLYFSIGTTTQNFTSANPLAGMADGQAETGAFLPFGRLTFARQVIKGQMPCSGAIFIMPLQDGKPKLVAWGFRNPFGLALGRQVFMQQCDQCHLGVEAGLGPAINNKPLRAIGFQCAFCHSTVDDSLMPGIGRPLDGWPNRDLDAGAIIAIAPNLQQLAHLLRMDDVTLRKILLGWGPGKYDAILTQDGIGFRTGGKSTAVLIPAAFGLAGIHLQGYTGWGSGAYWNAYAANTQMMGMGTFFDPRLDNASQFPVGAVAGNGQIRQDPDLVSFKLAALQFYQVAMPAPLPPKDGYDKERAEHGQRIFKGKARCAGCHAPPLFSEPGRPMHTGKEIGIDEFQANRSPDKRCRTTPLRSLFTRMKERFYHDGRFATLQEVIEHYNRVFDLKLTPAEQRDLAEYLNTL